MVISSTFVPTIVFEGVKFRSLTKIQNEIYLSTPESGFLSMIWTNCDAASLTDINLGSIYCLTFFVRDSSVGSFTLMSENKWNDSSVGSLILITEDKGHIIWVATSKCNYLDFLTLCHHKIYIDILKTTQEENLRKLIISYHYNINVKAVFIITDPIDKVCASFWKNFQLFSQKSYLAAMFLSNRELIQFHQNCKVGVHSSLRRS